MEKITNYFIPVILGYGIPCLLWFMFNKYWPLLWPKENITKPKKPIIDLGLGLVGAVAILLIGQLWSAGLLLPEGKDQSLLNILIWWLNNLIIFSPIFIVLAIRKQSLNTLFLNRQELLLKLAFGLASSFIGVELYMLFNGGHAPEIIAKAFEYDNARNFLPVFLEGVALAFLFVRLKWVVGLKWAIGIPAILFAAAHIPRALANDSSLEIIIIDSVLTAAVTVIVFATTAKSRDIIWLGLLHYFMDIAIGAFN